MGFLSPSYRLLFVGDLFGSFGRCPHFPPNLVNTEPALIPGSLRRVLAMDLHGALPTHGFVTPPKRHSDQLHALASRSGFRHLH
jgi:hypothetical protein